MLLAAVIWITSLLVAAAFAIKRWWFPTPINNHAAQFDSIFSANLVVAGIIFLAAQILLGWLIYRFRDRGQRVRHSEGNNRLEFLWTALTALLFIGAALASAGLWVDVHLSTYETSGLRIEVAAKQFAWSVRYAGADGRFGKTEVRLMNDATGNPFGIVDSDAAGKDDIIGTAVRVPAGRHIQLLLRSHDVIHNFFVRELRIKQDVVPGMDIPLHFRADKPGEYEIACSELCGLGHHQMRSVLIVMPPAEFDSWLSSQRTPR